MRRRPAEGLRPGRFRRPPGGRGCHGAEFDTAIQGTAFGGVEGRKVAGADADRFCWTAPLTTTGGGPAFRKPSGSLVCVEVRADPSCTGTSSSCGPTSCGNRSILVRSGQGGDSVCRTIAQQMAQSITSGERSFEMTIGFDIDRVPRVAVRDRAFQHAAARLAARPIRQLTAVLVRYAASVSL